MIRTARRIRTEEAARIEAGRPTAKLFDTRGVPIPVRRFETIGTTTYERIFDDGSTLVRETDGFVFWVYRFPLTDHWGYLIYVKHADRITGEETMTVVSNRTHCNWDAPAACSAAQEEYVERFRSGDRD